MKPDSRTAEGGFVALISVIIIAVVLAIITFSLSTSGFFLRFNILDNEAKKQSLDLAEACANEVMLAIASGSTSTPQTFPVGSSSCKFCSISTVGATSTVKVRAVTSDGNSNSYSNVTAVLTLNGTNFIVNSWDDVPTYSGPSCSVP